MLKKRRVRLVCEHCGPIGEYASALGGTDLGYIVTDHVMADHHPGVEYEWLDDEE